MEVLNKKWVQIDNNSRTLFPLFECFESVVSALGPLAIMFSTPIFERCLKVLQNFMSKVKADPDSLGSETDFFIRSMDLISFLFSAIGDTAQKLIVSTNFIPMLFELLSYRDNLIKQYVFAMLGDMQKILLEVFQLFLPQFIQAAIDNMSYDEQIPDFAKANITLCNNAVWFIGQVADSPNFECLKPFTPQIASKIATILQAQRVTLSLSTNHCIAQQVTGSESVHYLRKTGLD